MSGSIWKREISLGRKKQDEVAEQPAQEAPVTDRIDAYLPEAGDTPALPPTTGDYGWLTESFDPNEIPAEMPAIAAPPVSGPPPVAPPPPLPVAEPEPAPAIQPVNVEVPAAEPAEKKPFWKQELTLKRSPKQPKAPKQPKQPKEPKAKKLKEPKAKKVKAPKPEKQRAEPTEKKPPIWKRELKLGKTKEPDTPKEPRAKKQKQKAERGGPSKGAIVGLKIGASQVTAARVSNGPSPQLLQVARLPLPDGVVVGGELRDVNALAASLSELFSKNKLPKKGVRLGIANSRIGVRTFEIAGIDDQQQLANAIRFRAQETLPIPLEEAVLDWQLLSESTDPETGQTTRRVLLVVAYRELVDRYVGACRKAGLRVTGIDLEAFAMLRALGAPPSPDAPPPNGAQVVVNVGHDRSTFAVTDGRVCEFTRVLSWGGQSLSVAIARALDLTPSEATPIKHALSLVAQSTELPDGVTHESLATAREAVLRELQSFARELVSSLRFYQNQPGSLGIGELVLTGGTAHLPGLGEELNRLIGVPVRVGDPLDRVAIPKKFREPDCAPGSLTVAIGLGIED